MTVTIDTQTLKLHAAKDGVWFLDRDGLPRSSKMPLGEFLESGLFRSADCVRVIGSHCNAELITALYDRKVKEELQHLEVATPLVCRTRAERHDPAAVLYRMRRFALAPSQGGFHEVTDNDYAAYSLTKWLMATRDWRELPELPRVVRMHPAWRPLQFIPDLNLHACAAVLAYIVDPRWYIDMCYPDRTAKLEAAMGLTMKAQASVTLVNRPHFRGYALCELVRRCWKDPAFTQEVYDNISLAGPVPFRDTTYRGLRPGDFIWRVWGYTLGLGPGSRQPPRDYVVAELRASQRLVKFIRYIWLNELYRGATLPYGGGNLFNSSDFFRLHVVEAEAFDHYIGDR